MSVSEMKIRVHPGHFVSQSQKKQWNNFTSSLPGLPVFKSKNGERLGLRKSMHEIKIPYIKVAAQILTQAVLLQSKKVNKISVYNFKIKFNWGCGYLRIYTV